MHAFQRQMGFSLRFVAGIYRKSTLYEYFFQKSTETKGSLNIYVGQVAQQHGQQQVKNNIKYLSSDKYLTLFLKAKIVIKIIE